MKKMPISAIERTSITKLSFFIFIICIFISLKNQNADTKRRFTSTSSMAAINYFSSTDTSFISPDAFSSDSLFLSDENDMSRAVDPPPRSLEYDFYRDSCPGAEQKIRSVVTELYRLNSSVAPALLRLAFHDCFIQGCDASILLDPAEGIESEKDSPPNQSLKGFNVMDIIKSQIEEACPGVVSCSDILVLAARDGVVLAGGPFYPLCTGRRDSHVSFMDAATYDLPAPNADLPETLASFASRGFDERETVSLLGAHSIGVIHCKFYQNRLYNFAGTVKPDPSLDPELLKELRSKCIPSQRTTSPAPSPFFLGSTSSIVEQSPSSISSSSAAAPTPPPFNDLSSSGESQSILPKESVSFFHKEPGVDVVYEDFGGEFGAVYYHSLLQGKGLLYADQQLMAGEETRTWVRAYASDSALFRRDFALAMMKLSNLGVLTGPVGQIRINCSRVS